MAGAETGCGLRTLIGVRIRVGSFVISIEGRCTFLIMVGLGSALTIRVWVKVRGRVRIMGKLGSGLR